jgi:hypothetical protein
MEAEVTTHHRPTLRPMEEAMALLQPPQDTLLRETTHPTPVSLSVSSSLARATPMPIATLHTPQVLLAATTAHQVDTVMVTLAPTTVPTLLLLEVALPLALTLPY